MATETTDTMFVKPDFSQVTDRVGEGVYKTRIVDSKVGQWEGRDGKRPTTYINWTLETFDEAEEKNNGRRIFHRTPIEGPGAFRLQDFYRAATGMDCSGGFDRTSLHGQEVEVTVGVQKDNPQYIEVKSVKSIASH